MFRQDAEDNPTVLQLRDWSQWDKPRFVEAASCLISSRRSTG